MMTFKRDKWEITITSKHDILGITMSWYGELHIDYSHTQTALKQCCYVDLTAFLLVIFLKNGHGLFFRIFSMKLSSLRTLQSYKCPCCMHDTYHFPSFHIFKVCEKKTLAHRGCQTGWSYGRPEKYTDKPQKLFHMIFWKLCIGVFIPFQRVNSKCK